MLKKTCPHCGWVNYGSSEFSLWLCHKCETNLRHIPAEVITECFWCGSKMARLENGTLVCTACGWKHKEKEDEYAEHWL